MGTFAHKRFFAAEGAALRTIRAVLENAHDVRIATAYFAASGYQALQKALWGKRVRLLIGRPEGGEDRLRDVLDEFMDELSMGPQEGRTRAMRQLLEALEQGWMAVSVGECPGEDAPWLKAGYLYQHAKLYIADRQAAVVTSANFTHHGLCQSLEAGYVVTDREDVCFFVDRFDEYFAQAKPITDDLIEALRRWLGEYDPYTIYARALLELYGLPEEVPSQLPPLAEYQKGVASSVLRSLLEHNGAFLIASTGLGKTIIASHVAAYLRMREEIRSVLVVCPAGMREVWRRWMRAARLSSAEFSYHTLAVSQKERDSDLPRLEHELSLASEETLIILDESHRLRNEENEEGNLRLSHRRIRETVRKRGSKVLLLTATPYSKSIEDVRSQLALLPLTDKSVLPGFPHAKWSVRKLSELADLPPCTVLNIPDVVRHFSERDENGERFVRFGNKKLYFPRRIRLVTVQYTNPYDDLLAELLESGLLYRAVDDEGSGKKKQGRRRARGGAVLPGFQQEEQEGQGERDPLQEALFLHQFCSSPARVKETCEKMATGDYEYRFARQKELTEFIRQHQPEIDRWHRPKKDEKLRKLAEIIQDAGDQKVVVFCEYVATAKYVTEGLRSLFPRRILVETTVDKRGANLDSVLRRFAPVANEVLPEERGSQGEIRILVASRAISEGYNLQDASILVNYDMPWTVLELAQRMGRILRPWQEPRDIVIYNFVPSTMNNDRIRHAHRWKKRLGTRSQEHSSLAQIPVLIYEESRREQWEREYEMEALGRALYLAREKEGEMDLDEVINFVSRTDELQTSTFYRDLITISNPAEIRGLPCGIRSAKVTRGRKQLFLLLRRSRHLDTVIADWRGEPLPESFRRDEVMRLIRCLPEEPKAPLSRYPDDDEFDAWIERARNRWAERYGVSPSRLQIVCALALV